MRHLLSSGIYSFLNRGSTLVLGLINFLILIRQYSRDEFGTWALFLTLVVLIELLRNGLIQNAFISFYNKASKIDKKSILTSSILLNILFTTIISIIIFLLAPILSTLLHSEQLQHLLRGYIIILFLLIPFAQFNILLQANSEFLGILMGSFIRNITFTISIVIFYLFFDTLALIELLNYYAFGIIAGTLVYLIYCYKYIDVTFKLELKWINSLFHFGKYVFGTNLSSYLFKTTDTIMISALLGPSSVAIYNAATRFSNLIEYPTTSIAEVLYPESSKILKDRNKDKARNIYEKTVGINLAIVSPIIILVVLFSNQLITLFAGPDYYESANILTITILFGFISPFNRHFGTILDSYGKPNINFYVLFMMFIINIVFNYLFISKIGIIGAAYGTMASYVIGFIITQIILFKLFSINLFRILINSLSFYKKLFVSFYRFIRIK